MICGEVCAEKLKKIVYVGSGPILYFCFTIAAYSIYKHYANYKSPNHQEKIIGKIFQLRVFLKKFSSSDFIGLLSYRCFNFIRVTISCNISH